MAVPLSSRSPPTAPLPRIALPPRIPPTSGRRRSVGRVASSQEVDEYGGTGAGYDGHWNKEIEHNINDAKNI